MKLLRGENIPANATKKHISRFSAFVNVEYGDTDAKSPFSGAINDSGSFDSKTPGGTEIFSLLFSIESIIYPVAVVEIRKLRIVARKGVGELSKKQGDGVYLNEDDTVMATYNIP